MKSYMKKLTFIFAALIVVASAYGFDQRMRFVVEQLRLLDQVGGSSVGIAGIPHDFYLLYQYAAFASTDHDIDDMMQDPHPVVRIMGVKCALTIPFRKYNQSRLDALLSDNRELTVGPNGCLFHRMTVSEVVLALKRDPDFLGKGPFRRPNKSLEPTPTAVTPPAGAGDRAGRERG
jgi:hypothetical protein